MVNILMGLIFIVLDDVFADESLNNLLMNRTGMRGSSPCMSVSLLAMTPRFGRASGLNVPYSNLFSSVLLLCEQRYGTARWKFDPSPRALPEVPAKGALGLAIYSI